MSTAATLSSRIAPQRDADLLPPAADAPDQVPFKTWVAVVGSTIGAFLAILNIQVVGASLADIQGGIGAGLDDGGWITTSYLVAEIIVIPLSAWLANIFSLRTYLLGSTVVFLGLTAACASAHTLGQMIVIRAAQGFAGGLSYRWPLQSS
jgi:DHA2 family multidrug resistance protein